MSINQLLALFTCFLAHFAVAQNFSFTPGSDYFGTLEMEMYTEHYMYVFHDSPDSAHITWRVIENSCPSEWDIQMCDWQHCYSGMPNTGNMNAVAAGGSGYLRLIVNPYQIPGNGTVHFWIFPTGMMDQYVDVYFHFETTVTATTESARESEKVFAANDALIIQSGIAGMNRIYDIQGKEIMSFYSDAGTHRENISSLPSGIYCCLTAKGNRYKILNPY